jgi:hypothetical protein
MVRHPGYRVCTTLCVWRMPRPVQGVERPQWLALGAVRMAPRGLHSPGDRIIIAADAQEATKLEDSIGDLAADLFDHDPLDGAHMLTLGVIDRGAFHCVAADEARGLPRFWCHGISPHSVPVTTVRHLHRPRMPCPRGHGLAVSDIPDTHSYTRHGAKAMPHACQTCAGLVSAGETGLAQRDAWARVASGASVCALFGGKSSWKQGSSQTERDPLMAIRQACWDARHRLYHQPRFARARARVRHTTIVFIHLSRGWHHAMLPTVSVP